ncbi:rhamnogalacturonan lyase family protein [Bythopirellula goksoeyrii]|nr:LamG-like jellyroll fold domain-containing protein [Bythopirellula goksoeyrii]
MGNSLFTRKDSWSIRSTKRSNCLVKQLHFESLESRQLLSLTHWYTFNDGTGTDQVGSADLDLINGAKIVLGKAILSNIGVDSGESGSVQYLDLPPGALPNSGPLTVEVWFTTTAAPNWTRLFDFGNQSGGNGDSYFFYSPQTSNNDSRLVLSPGGISNERVTSGATTDDGQPHLVSAVIDTNNDLLRLYLDGNQVDTASLEGTDISSITKDLAYFGRSLYNNDDGFTGTIDEIRIYDEALSAVTVATHANEGPEPNPAPELFAPRQVEYLNRGVVALRRANSEVYIGWRMLGTDPTDVSFNLYRSTNGGSAVKLNAAPLIQTTDYVDTSANMSVDNEYFVRPIIQGIELAPSESFILAGNTAVQQHLTLPLQVPAGGTVSLPPGTQAPPSGTLNYTYNANDASVGDLDGDGQYEIILKWDPSNSKDNSEEGLTGNTFVDAYQLDGTFLWRIDMGRNIRSGAHYTQILVYDLDADGRAEIVMKTADGTIDGQGTVIGDPNADYRDGYSGLGDNRWGRVLGGPEFFTVFDGLTGAAVDTIAFEPERDSVSSWGDSYGNRQDRFQATVAYLDGVTPSIVWGRGYAPPQGGFSARNEVAAYDYDAGELSVRWVFEAATNGDNPGYVGQSAHSITVGDVDFDGKDEIITGASALDDDGTLLYNTGLGHGDALHLTDMDPSRPGLEIFMPHESPGSYGNAGGEFRDAATGALIFGIPATNDVGRGVAADIDPNSPGYEMWATTSGAGDRYIYSSTGQPLYEPPNGMSYNFLVWWDADLSRELLDGTKITEWTNSGIEELVSTDESGINNSSGLSSNNGSKSTPTLSGDILGDWREEVIWRRSDNSALEIWSTTIAATSRMVTLMHDTQYRAAIAWQNSGYNQPPHPSFYLGAGMADPPTPNIYTVPANPTIPGDFDLDGEVDSQDLGVWQQTYGLSQQHGYLPGDADESQDVSGADFLIWQRNFGNSQTQQVATLSINDDLPSESVEEFSAVYILLEESEKADVAIVALAGTGESDPSSNPTSWFLVSENQDTRLHPEYEIEEYFELEYREFEISSSDAGVSLTNLEESTLQSLHGEEESTREFFHDLVFQGWNDLE